MLLDGPSIGGPSFSFKETEGMNKRIIDLLRSPLQEMRDLGKVLQEEFQTKKNLQLEKAKELQEKYPQIILSGSVALYLHGIRLERFKKQIISDIDIIMPYYTLLEGPEFNNENYKNGGYPGDPHTLDFDHLIVYKGVLLDIKVDPKRHYEYVEMDDFKWKIAKIEDILEAKIRYIYKGVVKHKDDLYEMLGKKTLIPIKETPYHGGS